VQLLTTLWRATWTIAVVAGLPVGLARTVGPPWPDHLPDRAAVQAWLIQPLTITTLTAAVAILLWTFWAAAVCTAVADLGTWAGRALRNRRWRLQLRLPAPAQGMSALLLGTVAVTTLSLTGCRRASMPHRPSPPASRNPPLRHRPRSTTWSPATPCGTSPAHGSTTRPGGGRSSPSTAAATSPPSG
jgi:hypothetical protein